MATTYVLDTSAFIYGMMPGGEMETVPAVYAEVRDERSRTRLELAEDLRVIEPEAGYVRRVAEAAATTGDDKRISKADGDLLALALQEKEARKDVVLLTDDYAIQNVARGLGIRVTALRQKKSRSRVAWERQCTGCHRSFEDGEECPICGSPLRMRKRPITRGK